MRATPTEKNVYLQLKNYDAKWVENAQDNNSNEPFEHEKDREYAN